MVSLPGSNCLLMTSNRLMAKCSPEGRTDEGSYTGKKKSVGIVFFPTTLKEKPMNTSCNQEDYLEAFPLVSRRVLGEKFPCAFISSRCNSYTELTRRKTKISQDKYKPCTKYSRIFWTTSSCLLSRIRKSHWKSPYYPLQPSISEWLFNTNINKMKTEE